MRFYGSTYTLCALKWIRKWKHIRLCVDCGAMEKKKNWKIQLKRHIIIIIIVWLVAVVAANNSCKKLCAELFIEWKLSIYICELQTIKIIFIAFMLPLIPRLSMLGHMFVDGGHELWDEFLAAIDHIFFSPQSQMIRGEETTKKWGENGVINFNVFTFQFHVIWLDSPVTTTYKWHIHCGSCRYFELNCFLEIVLNGICTRGDCISCVAFQWKVGTN